MLVGLVDDLFNPTGAADGEAHYGNVLGFASGNGGTAAPAAEHQRTDAGWRWRPGPGRQRFAVEQLLVTASSVTFFANGNGGNGGNGGSAFGGSARITSNDAFIDLIRVDGLIDIAGNVTLEAAAASGNGSSGATGNASGGTAELQADGGDVTIGGNVFLSADGDAEDGAFGGQGQGGLARVDAYDGASLSAASLTVQALGEGGNGTVFAGSGDGGTAQVRAHSGASITTGNLTVDASATGGDSVTGGDAFGGDEASATRRRFAIDGDRPRNGEGQRHRRNRHDRGRGRQRLWRFGQDVSGVGDSGTGGATVTINNALVQANGIGGAGGTGGSGFGGGDPSETEGVEIGARLAPSPLRER